MIRNLNYFNGELISGIKGEGQLPFFPGKLGGSITWPSFIGSKNRAVLIWSVGMQFVFPGPSTAVSSI